MNFCAWISWQLYIIRRNLGDLLPRHMDIFKNNTYFFGLTIPDPGSIIPLDRRVPPDLAGADGVKFLKVEWHFRSFSAPKDAQLRFF